MKKVTYCIEQIQTLLINCASRFLLFFKPPEVAVGKLTLQKGLLEARGGGISGNTLLGYQMTN
jgi:hypothetical protein